jgi:hypothetical protein
VSPEYKVYNILNEFDEDMLLFYWLLEHGCPKYQGIVDRTSMS